MKSDSLSDRGLPCNLDAERYVLGSILLDEAQLPLIQGVLNGEEFSLESNRRIYAVMRDLRDRGIPVDRVTVAEALHSSGKLESIGGLTYLLSLDEGLPQLYNSDAYARIVFDKFERRQAIYSLQIAMDRILAGDAIAAVEHSLQDMRNTGRVEPSRLRTAGEIITEMGIDEFVSPSFGLRTGIPELDGMLCGLRPGQLIVIGARPGIGKTALASQIAEHASIYTRVGFGSLEMSASELFHRRMCTRSGVSQTSVRHGGADLSLLHSAISALVANRNLSIDDTPVCTVQAVSCALAREKAASHPIGMVVIDYLQLLRTAQRFENRVQQISEITRDLKLLAKEHSVPVLVLSQFSRNLEHEKRRPTLADLRDSGSIEQDADVVLSLWRNLADSTPPMFRTELSILKHRSGPLAKINLTFDSKRTTFLS